MKFPQPNRPLAAMCVGVLAAVLCLNSCDDPEVSPEKAGETLPRELSQNQIGGLPGPVYQSQANSPIHWQPWTKETFATAEKAGRLVMVVIAMPQQSYFQSALDVVASDPAFVDKINTSYVPVLLDADAAREMGLLTMEFCGEIQQPLSLPLLLWMTSAMDPVSWLPVTGASDPESISSEGVGGMLESFRQSHAMVDRIWLENKDYVNENSARNNEDRRQALVKKLEEAKQNGDPADHVIRTIRQLTSLYDPVSRTFDDAGGLFPAGSINLLASAAMNPSLPEDLRKRSLAVVTELLEDLLPSAMFDPLDGGIYSSRQGVSWKLPGFYRDCPMHGRAAVALFRAYAATGNSFALQRALNAIEFAEKSYRLEDGLFAFGMETPPVPDDWLWSLEDVSQVLSEENAKWWIASTGMEGLGNLPSEADPKRRFFRMNSLAVKAPLPELAEELGVPEADFIESHEVSRRKLLKVRNARIERSGSGFKDESAHAGASFRMVSAYAAAFCATGDVEFRNKAVDLLTKAKSAFSDGPRLKSYCGEAPRTVVGGRAFLYGLAIEAANDVADITTDTNWLLWSDDLATTAVELFIDEDYIRECAKEMAIIDLPVSDIPMLFDESSIGLFSLAECLAAVRGRPLHPQFVKHAVNFPSEAVDHPMLYTNVTQSTMIRHFSPVVVMGANVSPEMKMAVERLPLRIVPRRQAETSEEIPDGSVKIVYHDCEPRFATTPESVQEAVLRTDKNP